ncbi:hypothetical protein DOS84_06720 [Flavobacterium aquariorum]|uniref:Lipocalin-like domain-containing protein n=1 Tax=Flavobacterium aquariorum TaxID=2217670 RepID=A0A2W7VQ93_9FLAO|nr:hypothetical protein [Flavobacterium aquariorum]PZX94312.1 hypothetical protein DOS84_06720 [Flavobacterium aquariorum]
MFKKIIALLTLFIVLSSCTSKTEPSSANISGLWADVNSSNFKNCYVIIAQDGNKIVMTHYLEFKGDKMVEYGIGEIKETTVTYDAVVTKAIPGWAKKGKHHLTLNKQEDTLRGYYEDEKGNNGPIVFAKLK